LAIDWSSNFWEEREERRGRDNGAGSESGSLAAQKSGRRLEEQSRAAGTEIRSQQRNTVTDCQRNSQPDSSG
jgi:hypothetical protein